MDLEQFVYHSLEALLHENARGSSSINEPQSLYLQQTTNTLVMEVFECLHNVAHLTMENTTLE